MRATFAILAGLVATSAASAVPKLEPRQSGNPFEGRSLFVNPNYSESLEMTRQAFLSRGDTTNAAKVQYVQENVGTFVWISNIFLLRDIDTAIENARAAKAQGKNPIVGLVLYNIPDRDCSAGESSGELSFASDGLNRYRNEYVQPFAQKLKAASDLQFAVVLEPDAIGNMVTGGSIPFCANARGPQQEGIGYAISQLQASHIHLYLDVANGGWLGWQDNLAPTAEAAQQILQKANGGRIRGFSTNVSNYNPFRTDNPEPYTEGSPSPDEARYASNLANAMRQRGLPSRFIIDQGRVALPGARSEWGQWCNVAPAGFGQPPTTNTNHGDVDAIVWVKPGGESDGQCGMSGAPRAGAWFDAYAQMLAENAHPEISGNGNQQPTTTGGNTTPTNGNGNCAARWGQCGGQGWSGPTCCSEGTCQAQNPWYSQCL